jgi:pilus assembly protein CpaD
MTLSAHRVSRSRAIALGTRLLLMASAASVVAGCNQFYVDNNPNDITASVPLDYRARHPIAVKEGRKSLVVFVGAGRGGLSPVQRAEVLAFAQNWRREGTGGVTIDRPVGSPNERAASDTLKEVLSIIVQAGVPNHGIGIRPYQSPNLVAPLRLHFPKMVAEAGPCGLWPDDIGVTYDTNHSENTQYYNFGCASQRNLAAMVDNPADLVQPRSEVPPYTAKRTFGMEKWRKGESPATTYTDIQKGAISDLGK